MRKTMLEIAIAGEEKNGYKVYKVGKGMYSYNKRSNMGKAYYECEAKCPNAEVIVVTGGRAGQYKNDGYHFAVMFKEKINVGNV